MKKILILISALFLLFACNKNDNNIPLLEKELVGAWELERIQGYDTIITSPPGNGNIIIFETYGVFKRKKADSLTFTGYYQLGNKTDCYNRDDHTILQTNEHSGNLHQYIRLINGKLELNTPNCYFDGGSISYRKIN